MAKNYKAWPEGWPKSLNYPEFPVYGILDQTAARAPNRIALVFGGAEFTYGEFQLLTRKFASALASLGVGKGDRVAIHLPNCPQFAIAYYAILRLGAVFTPLSPLLAPKEALHQLQDCGAETIITLDMLSPVVKGILPQTNIKRVVSTSLADCYNPVIAAVKPIAKMPIPETHDMAALLKEHEPLKEETPIDVKKDLAHLAYTGGTTGVSKGVMLTHANVVSNVLQFSLWLNGAQAEISPGGVFNLVFPPGVDPEKRYSVRDKEISLIVVPWFHVMGTVGYLNAPVVAGNTMVVFPRFDPVEFMEAVRKYRATRIGGAPQLYIPLLNLPDFEKYDLSTVTIAASGAAPLPVAVLEKMMQVIPGIVIEAYGLSECSMGASANPPDRNAARPGSVGLPIADTEFKVVDLVTGSDLPPGSEGELCIKGPQVMVGYWNNPSATAEVLKDGWLFTGDIAREDEDGFFYITDRKKDMIIYKGYNVYPRELEEVLYHHPAVQQCAVVGRPDPEAGEIPVGFVELRKGAQATEQELIEFTNQQVAHYKKLRRVAFVPSIPVNPSGKVLRRVLKEKVAEL